jgi:hypothetical protein
VFSERTVGHYCVYISPSSLSFYIKGLFFSIRTYSNLLTYQQLDADVKTQNAMTSYLPLPNTNTIRQLARFASVLFMAFYVILKPIWNLVGDGMHEYK